MDDADRAEELAQNESLEVLWNALHSALEADLSARRWPNESRKQLEACTEDIENLIEIAEGAS